MRKIFTLILLLCSPIVFGHDMATDSFTQTEMFCYSKAMIGFDYVINARKGNLPENALFILDNHLPQSPSHPLNKTSLLITIMGAYLWKGSPHTYAIRTYTDCVETANRNHEIKQ